MEFSTESFENADTVDAVGSAGNTGRTHFTPRQVAELEKEFHYNRYLTSRRRLEMAGALGLKVTQIRTWFANRRMKWKRQFRIVRPNLETYEPREREDVLEVEFDHNKNLTPHRQREVAQLLDLNENQVELWFQKRHNLEREMMKKRGGLAGSSSTTSEESGDVTDFGGSARDTESGHLTASQLDELEQELQQILGC